MMGRYAAAYAATAVTLIALDLLWLGVIAKSIYQNGIGHLMADRPNIPVAILFYAIYSLGLVIFAVAAQEDTSGWSKTLVAAALFGFFAYATYDLTNLATLKNWPIGIALMDICWGIVVSAIAATAGRAALNFIDFR